MEQNELPVQQETTPAGLIKMAMMQPDFDIEKLERLLAMQERWEQNKSRKEFFEALSRFQQICPVIVKNSKADFKLKDSPARVSYQYATLDEIVSQIKGPLGDCGLSYRFSFAEEAEQIKVTCHLTHKNGHFELTEFSSKKDNTGAKNEIQSKGSTLTYLQRYTLIGALGIATAESDDDGGSNSEPGKEKEPDIDPTIVKAVETSTTQENLKVIWNLNTELHGYNNFKDLVNKKLYELKGAQKDGAK